VVNFSLVVKGCGKSQSLGKRWRCRRYTPVDTECQKNARLGLIALKIPGKYGKYSQPGAVIPGNTDPDVAKRGHILNSGYTTSKMQWTDLLKHFTNKTLNSHF
jgi:hypothetical protein